MPAFEVTGPDGRKYKVEAPEGATDRDAIAYVQNKYYSNQEESGFFRQTLDVPVKFGQGVATGIRLISDAFGADNPVSQNIRGVENWLQDLLSAQAKEDQREISRIMEEAKDAGVADQVVAALKAFGTAPIDFIAQAAGTALPTVVGGLAGAALRAPAVVGLAGTGAAMGAGTIKSSIYDATYETLREAGASDEEAREKAVLAQEYGGENLDQILIGTVLGGVAGRFGVEPAVARQIAGDIAKRSIAKTALKEAGTEAVQAGQEQVAQNIALQRQGFDVPTARGVAGAATLEALAGAGLGAGVEALRGRGEGISPDLTREDIAPPPPTPPVTPPPPAGEVAPPPTAPQVDEGVPEWLRQELDSVVSTSQAAKAIVDMESVLGDIAETLGSPETLARAAKERKLNIPVLEERLRGAADELQTRLPAYRQRLNELRTEADQEAAAEREAIQAYEREQAAAAQAAPPVTPPAVTPPVTPPGAAPAVTPPAMPPGAAAPPIAPAAQVPPPPPVDPTLLKALNIDPQQLAPPTPPTPPMPAAPVQQMGLPGMEAPSVPATPTSPITPPIGTQPVGGGTALPTPRPATAGPEITEPTIEGVEPVERVTPDVVGGAEPVQPALTVEEVEKEIADRKVKRQEAIDIARSNAESAFADGTSERTLFQNLDESIGAYSDNVRDTLQEYGLEEHTDAAIAAYDARIRELTAAEPAPAPVTAPVVEPEGPATVVEREGEEKRIKESAGNGVVLQYPNYKTFVEETQKTGMSVDDIAEITGVRNEQDFLDLREQEINQFVEAPAQDAVRRVYEKGGQPYSSNAFGPGRKGVEYIDAEGAQQFEPLEPTVTEFKAPDAFNFYVTNTPAYEGVEPLSIDDADFELEVLEGQAQKGRLTPAVFANSEIGKRLDTPTVSAINDGIRADPVATIQALRQQIQQKATPTPAEPTAPAPEPAALPEVPRLREDATDEEIRQYYEAIRAREAAMGVKPTPVVGRLGRKVSRSRQTDEDVELQRGPVPATPVMSVPEVEAAAEETVKGWANAPTIVIAANSNDAAIPENVRSRITPDTRSAYDPNTGTVYVMADRAADKATLRGTIYHEALGHFGLRDEFNTRLDKILEDIYRTNPKVREEAEKLKAKYEDLTSNARAVQEVLAIRSEAGPIKEAGIRAAFNRVAAFIRRIGRAVGFPVAYSNNDVAQILAQAHRRVTGVSPPATVKEKIKQDKKLINAPAEQVLDLDPPTPNQMSGLRNAMRQLGQSQVGVNVRKLTYGFMSMQELADAFVKEVPGLKGLIRVLNQRAYKLKVRRLNLEDKLLKWTSLTRKHRNQLEKFYSIALESTRLQVEFDNPAFNNHSLTAEFRALHPDLQRVYRELLAEYKRMADEYIDTVVKNLPDTAANALRAKFESNRLKVYLPLYREGNYWMRYQDKDGETVVRAFPDPRARDLAWGEALREGAKQNTLQTYVKADELYAGTQPGGGFFSDVVKELDTYYDGNTPAPVKQVLYELFLDTIPASSVRQQFRKREGYKGADRNLLGVFAMIGTRMETQLNNLEFAPQLDEARKVVNEDIAKAAAEDKTEVVALQDNLEAQMEFLQNPVNSSLVNFGVFASYADFILGNISSALANLTQLPMTVYPMLAGEYGLDKAQKAMENATRMYFSGGWDNRGDQPDGEAIKRWPADRTIFDPSKIPANSPLGRLYEQALQTNTIKHSTAQDLLEARGQTSTLSEGFLPSLTGENSYIGFWNKSKQVLGWAFQNTERFNREITLVAGYELAMEKGKSLGKTGKELENYAIERAIRLTNETHGVALTELGPRFFQTGVLKVAFTFKNFARTQYYLQYRLLKDAIKGMEIDTTGMSPEEKTRADALNKEFRQIAIKQWLGVLTGAFTFAGVQGLPFYGAGIVLASLADAAFGDDDDPVDPEDKAKRAVGSLAFKGPVNELLGVDIAARTGFNDMLWRDDPKRLGEIGTVLYTLEQVMGPAYGTIRRRERAIEEFNAGNLDRALELTLPVWMANALKTLRYSREGVLNRKGDMRVTEDLDSYQLFSQAIGFTPTEVSEAYAKANARKRLELNFDKRRNALIDRAYLAYIEQDREEFEEALQAIEKFNQSRLTAEFNGYITTRGRNNTLLRSFRERQRRAAQSMDGMYYNPKKAEALKREVPE